MTMIRLLLMCLAFALVCSVGCSRGPELSQASGTVSYEGKPVPSGSITFYPSKGRPASGIIQADGTFTLSSYKRGDGLPIGKYKVCVTAYKQIDAPANLDEIKVAKPAEHLVPKVYSSPLSSPIELEVTESGENHFKIELPVK